MYYRWLEMCQTFWQNLCMLGTYANRQVKTPLGEVEEVLTLPEYLSRRVTNTWKKAKKAKQVTWNLQV